MTGLLGDHECADPEHCAMGGTCVDAVAAQPVDACTSPHPPTRAFDPAGDAPLTVRQHPGDGRTDPDARRAIRTPGGPWLAISGPDAGRVLAEHEVRGWPVPHPAWWSPAMRRDLDHLLSHARSEVTR